MNIFEDIKNRLDIETVANHYGVTVKNHKAFCPFHSDGRTPNLSFKNNIFKCFACNTGGDAVAFVAQLFNTTQFDAAKKINEDFGLELDISAPTRTEAATYKQDNILLEMFDAWKIERFTALRIQLLLCNSIIEDAEPFSDMWATVVHYRFYIEYELEHFINDDIKALADLFTAEVSKQLTDNRLYKH